MALLGLRLPSPKIAQPLLSTLIWRSTQGIDIAKRDIEDAIAGIRTFPAEMTDEPMVGKIIPGKLPILEIALSGPTESVRRDALNLEKKLKSLEGVGEVTVVGYRDPEVRVFYDPERVGP